MMVNQRTIELIKEFEGCELTAYQDIVGIWTIGYGTTAAAGLGIEPRAGMKITQAQAEELLERAVDDFGAQVAKLITVPVTQNEFGALVSLSYNIGVGAFSKSTVLRELNSGNKASAGSAFHMWNKAGGNVVNGLVRRRELEHKLFGTPDPAPVARAQEAVSSPAQGSILALIIRALAALFGGRK
jgi:GH24 family phage-related lysozyme (muramidase)